LGKATADSNDDTLALAAGVFTSPGQTTIATAFSGRFNLHIAGAFTGSIVLERSFDGAASFVALTNLGDPVAFTGPASEALQSNEENVFYRLRAVTLSAGAAQVRISQ